MRILAIETSCDDTGIAILEVNGTKNAPSFNVLSNIVASQIEVHKKYGGVFPAMAKREHQRNLLPTFIKALKESKLLKISNFKFQISNKISNDKFKKIKKILEREPELEKKLIPFFKKHQKPDIDLIAVTNGPGLEPCLWVGVNFAKALSYFWDIPIVPVNHIESHILVNFLPKINEISKSKVQISNQIQNSKSKILFPSICLVVSGGHTQIILMEKPFDFSQGKLGKYKILGETRDDAAGECFDKAAKILGLDYPGGPIIAKLAEARSPLISGERASAQLPKLPRPMINTKDYDFSFSGLKTAILYHHRKQPKNIQKSKKYIQEMAAEIQQAIIDVLIKKTIKAAKDYKAKTIILGGGVSANHELKTQMLIKIKEEMLATEFLFPEIDHSTDNGLMTAVAGYYNKNKTVDWKKIEAKSNLRIS